jgi:hypothetical protein
VEREQSPQVSNLNLKNVELLNCKIDKLSIKNTFILNLPIFRGAHLNLNLNLNDRYSGYWKNQ